MRYLLLITTVALNFVGCTDLDHDNALTQNQLTAQLSDVARWVNPKSVLAKVGNRDNIVNKVSRPFWEKTRFNPDYETKALSSDEWYYRFTVVDAPPNTTALSVADGHWLHPETIRWEITEKFLIGWRAHAVVPGSEDENFDAQDYKGAPVAVFPILEHFDINLSYDAITLEPTNVLAENMDDRQWQKREFFRVDWSQNVAHEKWRTDPYAGRLGAKTLDVDTAHAVANNNPAAPRHYRFEQDYLEVTTRQAVTTDLMALLGYYGEAFGGDGAAPVVSARHSFKKKVKTNYETLHYPNSLALRGFDGQEVRDDKGFSKMIPLWEKFGFYRSSWSGRQTWDKEKGSTESGKQYNITRFNKTTISVIS